MVKRIITPRIRRVRRYAGGSWRFFRRIRVFLIIAVFAIVFINFLIIIAESNALAPGIEYLGGKLLDVTASLGEESLKIIEQGGVVVKGEGFFSAIGDIAKTFWVLFESLIIIFAWIIVLSWIMRKLFVQDDSKTTLSYTLGLGAFFFIQMLYLTAFSDKSMLYPFKAFWYFIKSIPYFIKPLAPLAEKVIGGGGELINETINNV